MDRTQFMALLPGFNGAIQWGSSGALGVHERLEESGHKMIHNGKNAENQLIIVFWGRTWKNTEIFHSPLQKCVKRNTVCNFLW